MSSHNFISISPTSYFFGRILRNAPFVFRMFDDLLLFGHVCIFFISLFTWLHTTFLISLLMWNAASALINCNTCKPTPYNLMIILIVSVFYFHRMSMRWRINTKHNAYQGPSSKTLSPRTCRSFYGNAVGRLERWMNVLSNVRVSKHSSGNVHHESLTDHDWY